MNKHVVFARQIIQSFAIEFENKSSSLPELVTRRQRVTIVSHKIIVKLKEILSGTKTLPGWDPRNSLIRSL